MLAGDLGRETGAVCLWIPLRDCRPPKKTVSRGWSPMVVCRYIHPAGRTSLHARTHCCHRLCRVFGRMSYQEHSAHVRSMHVCQNRSCRRSKVRLQRGCPGLLRYSAGDLPIDCKKRVPGVDLGYRACRPGGGSVSSELLKRADSCFTGGRYAGPEGSGFGHHVILCT